MLHLSVFDLLIRIWVELVCMFWCSFECLLQVWICCLEKWLFLSNWAWILGFQNLEIKNRIGRSWTWSCWCWSLVMPVFVDWVTFVKCQHQLPFLLSMYYDLWAPLFAFLSHGFHPHQLLLTCCCCIIFYTVQLE